MSDMIKLIKELRTTISEQTEAINTERIINSEQAKQLKEAETMLNEVKGELEWAQMTVREKLKFGLPEEIAITRREGRCRGVFLTTLESINEYLAKYKGKE